MKIATIILFILLVLIIFVAGGAAGIFYQSQNHAQNLSAQPEKIPPFFQQLSLKTVASVSLEGFVKSINQRNIVLSNDGDEMTVNIADSTPIFSVSINNSTPNTKLTFDAIKVGNKVSVNVKISPDNTFLSQVVYIYPLSNARSAPSPLNLKTK